MVKGLRNYVAIPTKLRALCDGRSHMLQFGAAAEVGVTICGTGVVNQCSPTKMQRTSDGCRHGLSAAVQARTPLDRCMLTCACVHLRSSLAIYG